MATQLGEFKGVVRGGAIELDRPVALPDGQEVTVVVRPSDARSSDSKLESLRRAFGGWAEDGEELDEFLRQVRRDRDADRPELAP